MAGDVHLNRSPISVAGMVLTTVSAVRFLADVLGLGTNTYFRIVSSCPACSSSVS
jgi:hypothetical protein